MSGIKSVIFNEIIKYAQDDFSTAKDRKELVKNIFSKLDTNGDNKLSDKDEMNDFYKKHFGIELSDKSITQDDLLKTIDDVAVEMSFEDAPESDFSKDYVYVTPEDKKKAYEYGKEVFLDLDGETIDNSYYTDVNNKLAKINKGTVIDFLDGYYSVNNMDGVRKLALDIFYEGKNPEGIIEFLDDEHDGGVISMANKKNIINSLLQLADAKGLSEETSYKRIKRILEKYEEGGPHADKKDFNNDRKWGWTGVLRSGIEAIINGETDNEEIDREMKVLCNKIKALQET